jgi:hypothetical protein
VIDQTQAHLDSLDETIIAQAYTMVIAAREAGIPLTIISGRRTSGYNAEIGGAPRSYHLDGLAFDVGVWGYTREQIPYWWWERLGAWGEQTLNLYWGGRFTHGAIGLPPARDVNHFDARRLLKAA